MLARKKRGRRDAAVRDTLKSVRSTVDTVVRRLVGSTDPEYEDLVQSSLVNVLATFDGGKFRGECPPRGWAAVIARNVAVDAIRARARERRVIAHDGDSLADERGRAEGDLGPERLTDLRETLDRVNRALSRPRPQEGARRLSARRARVPAGRGCHHAGHLGRRGSVAPGARPPGDHRGPSARNPIRWCAAGGPQRGGRGAASAAQAAVPRANLTAGFPGTYARNFLGGNAVTAASLLLPTSAGGSHGCIRNAHAAHRAGRRDLRGRGVARSGRGAATGA